MTTNRPAKITRLAPGEYAIADYRISHIEAPDEGNGYGATDHWIVVDADGYCWEPFATLRDAKAAVTEALAEALA